MRETALANRPTIAEDARMVDDKSPQPDLPLELAREIAREGEAMLSALLATASAADQRAGSMCSAFGAAATAVAGATLAYWTSANPKIALLVAGGVLSLGMYIAAALAAAACTPNDWYLPGGHPKRLRDWAWHDGNWRGEAEFLDGIAGDYDRGIRMNSASLAVHADRLRRALWVAAGSPIFALITFLGLFLH